MKILFVWDFHGTLEKDNVYAVRDIINKTLESYQLKRRITLEETVEHYGLSWVDYFQYLHPEGNLDIWKEMKEKARGIQKRCKLVEKYIKPADYADYVLKKINEKGHINIVLSNSAPKWIKHFVRLVKLEKHIDQFFGLDLHDVSRRGQETSDMKFKVLDKYIDKSKFEKIIKIGDRDSDIIAGQKLGAVTYYVINKFNKNKKINIKPDYIISDLRKVLREI